MQGFSTHTELHEEERLPLVASAAADPLTQRHGTPEFEGGAFSIGL